MLPYHIAAVFAFSFLLLLPASPWQLFGTMEKPAAGSTTITGVYKWVPVIDIKNQQAKITIRKESEYGITVNEHVFRDEFTEQTKTQNLNVNFNAGFQFKLLKCSSDMKYDLHTNAVHRLNESLKRDVVINERKKVEETYEIPVGGSLCLYQIQFSMPGVSSYDYPFVDTYHEDVTVVLGCEPVERDWSDCVELIRLLGRTQPQRDNKGEWAAIRDCVSQHITDSIPSQIDALIRLFSTITPGRSNTGEWATIRKSCSDALQLASFADRVFKYYYTLSTITPGRDNKGEWQLIRDCCHQWLGKHPRPT